MKVQPLTKEQAVALSHRDNLYHLTARNTDGTAARCRVNGACKVWVTRPTEFRLPVKYGLYDAFYITAHNACNWSLVDPTA